MRFVLCSFFVLFLLIFVKNEEGRFLLLKRNEAKGNLGNEMNEANNANGYHSMTYQEKSMLSRLYLIEYDFLL